MKVIELMERATALTEEAADAASTKGGALVFLLDLPYEEVRLALTTMLQASEERLRAEYGDEEPDRGAVIGAGILSGIEIGIAAERMRAAS